MKRDIEGATVVITGASSGIGRAAALAFAREGARLVLAARSADVLDEVAAECRALGGEALAVPTDVNDAEAMRALATRAKAVGGRIDVWVNNAGVGTFGPFLDTPVEAHDQVIRTNLIGYLHGAHAVLPHFREQGGGVLINLVSLAAWIPTPMSASYAASKYGIRGFSEALRVELATWDADVRVCDIFPGFVDTPIVSHVGNYAGAELKAVPPVITPEAVADKIVELSRRPKDNTPMGAIVPVALMAHRISPRLFRWAAGRFAETYVKLGPSAPRDSQGVFEPAAHDHVVSLRKRSPALRAAGIGLAAAAGAGWLLARSRRAR